ncbi:rhodanese-related sulfurtransferase [Gramella sp. Hel_I_59]|nr:rhodanese-related sulfurtransferase [Gramella sp. Hel_I_59]
MKTLRFLSNPIFTVTKNLSSMKELSQDEWQKKAENDDKAVLLDVRTEEEVDEGYIPNSKNIDIYKGQEFVDEVDKLDRDKHYYIYCRSGKRSSQACTLLDQMGFAETYNLAGGFSEWEGEKETN